jgi:predicted transcriptional regulator
MSAPSSTNQSAFDSPMMRPFMDLWSQLAKETSGAGWNPISPPVGLNHPSNYFRKWEHRWMDAMSDSLDAYLRSPQFLDWMRHQSDFAVKTKQQSDNVTKEFARNAGIPTSSDISGLYERLHSFEDCLIRRLDEELFQRMKGVQDQLGTRLSDSLSKRLDRLEESLQATPSPPSTSHSIETALERLHKRLDDLEATLLRMESKPGRVTPRSRKSQTEPPAANRSRSREPRASRPPVKKPANGTNRSAATKPRSSRTAS